MSARLLAALLSLLLVAVAFVLLLRAAEWSLRLMARFGWASVAAAWAFAWLVVAVTVGLLLAIAVLLWLAELAERRS